jgi:hypothetical protein
MTNVNSPLTGEDARASHQSRLTNDANVLIIPTIAAVIGPVLLGPRK